MQKEENKFVPSTLFEGMVSIRAVLASRKEGISDRKIEQILYTAKHAAKHPKEIAFLRHEAGRSGFSLLEEKEDTLSRLTLGNSHGGIVALCSERTLPRLTSQSEIAPNGFYVMLEGIEDPYNFGYALRSLYALGVTGVIVSERNWLSAAGVLCRASAGASERFMFYQSTPEAAVDIFKSKGYSILCADANTEKALEETALSYPILLVVGGEKRGISRTVMDKADIILKITYGRPFDGALSAASATTILAYEIAKQNRK